MAHQNPFGGAPRIGNGAPGEPSAASPSGGVDSFGGAPLITGDRDLNRGNSQVGRSGAGVVVPEPYGGGAAFVKYPDAPGASGVGDSTGAGATNGNTVP